MKTWVDLFSDGSYLGLFLLRTSGCSLVLKICKELMDSRRAVQGFLFFKQRIAPHIGLFPPKEGCPLTKFHVTL
jgi:hypothetical protein